MPRGPRRDAPGCVHHVTARGIEKRAIFLDDRDRDRFLELLESVLLEAAVVCIAWALMPNHFHLVLRTAQQSLPRVMARLNTAYAVGFNLRYDRAGHLFQNRYHSKVIGDDDYLRTAIRYVHRNPLDAGLVPDLTSLECFPWSGHAALMGRLPARFLHVDGALAIFADDPAEARVRLREWMATPEPRPSSAPSLTALGDLIEGACLRLGISKLDLLSVSRDRRVCSARSLIAHLACDDAGYRQADVARALGIQESSVHRARRRGRAVRAALDAKKQDEGTSPKAR